MPSVTVSREIECSERALVIAKALFAATNYPGRANLSEVLWPPRNNSTLVSYVNKAKAVDQALTAAGF